jgi:DNA-binding Lrp family transcriptional regulator
LALSDGLNGMKSVKYSFEEINGGSRYDMAKQFGHSGVKAYLYEKKYQKGDESLKDSKEYQQNLLAQKSGYTNYREMGEALKKGKLSKYDVLNNFRELEKEGLIDPEHFIIEKKDSIKDKLGGIKKYADPKTSFVKRNDIQQKLLRNEINSYAQEEGYIDDQNNPDALSFLQAIDSGDYRNGRVENLVERYKDTFDSIGYAGPDYENYKEQNGLIPGEYTIENIAE